MREGMFTIKESLNNGLRIDDRLQRGSPFLTEAKNVRITAFGKNKRMAKLVLPVQLIDDAALLSYNVNKGYPFPQVFRGRNAVYLLSESEVFILNVNDGTLQKVNTYDPTSPEELKEVSEDGIWNFIDFGKAFILLNGTSIIYRSAYASMFGGSDKAFVREDITINAGCAFRGRSVLGGFSLSDFYDADWKSFWKFWISKGVDVDIDWEMGLGSNFVMWSLVGGGDMLALLDAGLIEGGALKSTTYGTYDKDNPAFLEMLARGDSGFMPMNWSGTVLHLKGLGRGVMVYGSNGISYMPIASNTFGLVDVLPIGVLGRGAVGGDESEHVFVDAAGFLWRIGSDLQPQKLGYREFFEGMDEDTINISMGVQEREYFIGDDSSMYLLGRGGLSEVGKCPITVVNISGTDYAIFDDEREDEELLITTEAFDFGLRGMKLIERLSIGMSNSITVYAKIYWRMNENDDWSETEWKTVNPDGVVWFPIEGSEFKISLKASDYSKVEVDYISVFFKFNDKRYLRGAYAIETLR